MKTRRTRGFTLIEMLLVISLIVLLISMLLPALKYAMDTSGDRVCSTNLDSLYKGTARYAMDRARRMPSARGWVNDDNNDSNPSNDGHGWWWFEIEEVRRGDLYEYVGSEQTYVCPVFLETRSWWMTYSGHDYKTKTPAFTYSLNEYVSGKHKSGGGRDFTWNAIPGKPGIKNVYTIDGGQRPAELCMFTDENAWVNRDYAGHPINNGAMGVGRYRSATLIDCIGSFHQAPSENYNDGSSNVVFMDGHVDMVHVSLTKEVVTPQRWKDND